MPIDFSFPEPAPHSPPLILADIGNSSIHLRLVLPIKDGCEQSDFCWKFDSATKGLDADTAEGSLSSFFEKAQQSDLKQPICVISSVNKIGSQILVELLNQDSFPKVMVQNLEANDLGLKMDVDHPERTGIDRLVAAAGIRQLIVDQSMEKEFPGAVIVDAGSAVTVDLLDQNLVFQGGMIFPGPGLASWSLSAKTDALPKIEIPKVSSDSLSPLARNTTEAIQAGLFFSQRSAILGCVQVIENLLEKSGDPSPMVFACGGGLRPFEGDLPSSWIQRDNLVLDGLLQWSCHHLMDQE